MDSSTSPSDTLRRLLTEPGAIPSAEEVRALDNAFPFLSLPAAMRLSRAPGLTPEERQELISRVAVGAPGRDTLFRLMDPDGDLIAGFMPEDEPAAPTATDTDSAIDTFLSTYGAMSPSEEALLEKMIFNPVPPDYVALLASEGEDLPAEESLDEAAAAIAPQPEPDAGAAMTAEAAGRPRAERRESVAAAPPDPSSSLSESLAQVYIRRGRFDKAYDIIHALSLNNPKKSVYFADQLRYLQKLMLIQRHQPGA